MAPRKPRPTRFTVLRYAARGPFGAGAPARRVHPVQTKHKMTKKQFQQYLKFIRTHHLGIYSKHPRKAVRPLASEYEFPGTKTYWILNNNDTSDTCAITAIANHLLVTQQYRVPQEHLDIAPEGASLAKAVAWAEACGMGEWELAEAFPVDTDARALLLGGVVLGMQTPWGPHAVTTMGGGHCISWGRMLRIKPPMEVDEAWYLEWKRTEA